MNRDDGSALGVVFDGGAASVELGGFANEGEPEPRAFGSAFGWAVGVEAVKGFFECVVRETETLVFHRDGEFFAKGGEKDLDGAVLGAEVEGVLEQVL